MTEFQVVRTEASAQALFFEPAFQLLRDPLAVIDQLLKQLPMRVRAGEVHLVRSDDVPAGVQLKLPLFGLGSSAVFSHESVLLRTSEDAVTPDPAAFVQAFEGLVQAARFIVPSLTIAQAIGTLTYTGFLPGTTTTEFLDRFVKRPRLDFGQPFRGGGVALYFGDESKAEPKTAITLDRWPPQENGLFLRVHARWESPETVPPADGMKHIENVLEQLKKSENLEIRIGL